MTLFTPTIEKLAPLLALLVAAVVVEIGGVFDALIWLAAMIPHEVGHAYGAWLSGYLSIPTFGMAVHWSTDFSYTFSACFLGVVGAAGYFAHRAGYLFWFGVCVFTIVTFFVFLFISKQTQMMISIWAGQAAELVFSAAILYH